MAAARLLSVAIGLSRVYLPLFVLTLLLMWFLRLYGSPAPPDTLIELVERARFGSLPGLATLCFAVGFMLEALRLFISGLWQAFARDGT